MSHRLFLFAVGFVIGHLAVKLWYGFRIKRIRGCQGGLYLTRIELLQYSFGSLMINYFHCSDEDRAMHDHPWTFYSLILWRGYIEHTPSGAKRIRPLRLIRRPCWWRHRVEMVDGKPALTLVWTGRKVREWGFHTDKGWMNWRDFGRTYCNDNEKENS